jgi:hypothetical protein
MSNQETTGDAGAGPLTLPRDPKQSEIASRIRTLQRDENWNGFGGHAVSTAACDRAVDLLAAVLCADLPEPTSFGPSPRGAVGLEWRQSDALLFVEVYSPEDVRFQLAGKERTRGAIHRNWELIDRLIEMYGR